MWISSRSIVAAAGTLGLLQASLTSAQASNVTSTVVPNVYIVELANTGDNIHGTFLTAATSNTNTLSGFQSRFNFTSTVFNGTSIQTDASQAQVAELSGVLNVWPVQQIQLTLPNVNLWGGNGNSGDGGQPQASNSNYSIHTNTGVDVLQQQGVLGKGAVVGMIGTGVDWTHPALGGSIGPGNKILGGWDFIGYNSTWPTGPLYPNDQPFDQLGEGTHQAGILAAQGPLFTGVAPEAQIIAYKVVGKSSTTTTEILADAFLMAFAEGVDIITNGLNLALGGGFTSDVIAVLSERITEQGVIIVSAVGDFGVDGAVSMGTGLSTNTLGVSCSQPEFLPGTSGLLTLGKKNPQLIAYIPENMVQFPATVLDYDIWLPNLDLDDYSQACRPLPADTPDLSNMVVLIRQALGCNQQTQQNFLEAFNASYILFYNDALIVAYKEDLPTAVGTSQIGTTLTATAALVINELKSGGTTKFTAPSGLTVAGIYGGPNYSGYACSYGSWGPMYDLEIKPDILAPGDNIFSTWLRDSYAVRSGTALSTAYMAGVAALYVGQNSGSRGKQNLVQDFANSVISSGQTTTWVDVYGQPTFGSVNATVAQIGAGTVNALTAIRAKTSVSQAKFTLLDTAHIEEQTLVITNNGLVPVKYKFTLEPSEAFNFFGDSPLAQGHPLYTMYPYALEPEVDLPGPILVLGRRSETIKLNFSPPKVVNASAIPIYSGKVAISGDNGDKLGITYLGVAADLNTDLNPFQTWSPQVWPNTNLASLWPPSDPIDIATISYSYGFPDVWWGGNGRYPFLDAYLNWGIQELRWDIFSTEWDQVTFNYPPVVGQDHYLGSATYISSGTNAVFQTRNFSNTSPFPLTNIERVSGLVALPTLSWPGYFANGSTIVNGNYTQRIAGLKPLGDPTNVDDWVVHVFPMQY